MRPLVALLFLLGSSGLFAQSDTTEKFVFLEYGFAEGGDCSSIKYIIGSKWNVHYKRVANCMVTRELVDSVGIFNSYTSERLTEKYGADWEERYQLEIAEAREKCIDSVHQSKIDTVVRENDYVFERVINNPDDNILWIELTSKRKRIASTLVSLVNLLDDSNHLIYRGFPNLFEIRFPHSVSPYFRIESINCTIKTVRLKDSLPAEHYCIKPVKYGETSLNFYSGNHLIYTHSFSVENLPDPEIYINDIPNGGKLPMEVFDSTLTIDVRYQDSISLRSEFQVELWELGIAGDPVLIGSGSRIDKDRLKPFKEESPGDQLQLVCNVRCPDGTLRKKAGVFILE